MSKRSKNRQKIHISPQSHAPENTKSIPTIVKSQKSIITESFSGPIPPPTILEKYNLVVPDAANRIIRMAEEQAQHRRTLESKAIGIESRNSFFGLIAGFIIGMSGIVGGAIAIVGGHEVSGTLYGSAALTSLVSVFVYGSKNRRKEREEKLNKLLQK